MTKKNWYRCAAFAPHHHDQSKATGEAASQATKHNNQSGSAGPNAPPKKKKGKTWNKYLSLLSRFQNKMKHRAPAGGLRQRSTIKRFSSRSMLEECGNVARVIRRAAADCFAAAVAGGGDEDEPPCYVQLDQVRYGVKREAFGPVYLVT